MKYLLVIVIALAVLWLWRNSRRTDSKSGHQASQAKPAQPPGVVTEIVACGICQVHLPRAEALPGPGGLYCCVAHRQQAGG